MFFNPDVLMKQVHSHYETEGSVQGHSLYERVESVIFDIFTKIWFALFNLNSSLLSNLLIKHLDTKPLFAIFGTYTKKIQPYPS